MQIQAKRNKYEFNRSVALGFVLLIFVVIGAGCAAPTPPPEQGHVRIQSGQTSAEVSWPK